MLFRHRVVLGLNITRGRILAVRHLAKLMFRAGGIVETKSAVQRQLEKVVPAFTVKLL